MPNLKKCEKCNGNGFFKSLINQHDKETKTVECETCKGKGILNIMTESEENDYWEDYW